MKKKKWSGWIAALLCGCLLAGCGAQTEIDDYAMNSVDGSDEQGTESSVAGIIRHPQVFQRMRSR